MTPAKQEILMQGQTGIAKKVYECVPVQESWQTFQIVQALKNMTGSQADVRVVQGCLNDLVDAGLIRESQRRFYQRIQVEEKPKPKEVKMPAAQSKAEQPAIPAKPANTMEILGELAAEVVGMAEHLKRLAARVEDVALIVEQERESSAKSMEQYRQLRALIKTMQGEGE